MLRWKKHSVIKAAALTGLAVGGLWFFNPEHSKVIAPERAPAGAPITDFSPEQINKAEWSVSALDFETSNPGRGRSYFDTVFSQMNGDQRIYNVPYPFQKVLDRVNQYMGYSGQTDNDNALKTVLFPLGRSLQRNAALGGNANAAYDINLFFRYPRVVVGIDRETKDANNPLALNLKGRMYLGFHERSKVIEAISYNDQEGRFEYQVVRDYEAGKTPKVVYANRQVCLGCHQNQTPIFSTGPWQETNAHLPIYSVLEKQMQTAFGDVPCDGSRTQPYCYTGTGANKKYQYFGAPTRVDTAVPYAIDTLTDKNNYFHAFQKMWLTLCQTDDCQKKNLKSILTYLLNGQEGVFQPKSAKDNELVAFEGRFRQRFPNGMKIPSANIPNRDPLQDRKKTQAEIEASMKNVDGAIHASLQDVISRSAVSGEFEPLMVRGPSELWLGTEPDKRNTNLMQVGFANLFSAQDARLIDSWIIQKTNSAQMPSWQLQGDCQIQKSEAAGGIEIQMTCQPKGKAGLALETGYFQIQGQKVQTGLMENLFLYGAGADCDWQASQDIENRVNGTACPAVIQTEVQGSLNGDILTLQPYHLKTGVSARLIDGRRVAKIQVNLKTNQLQVMIVDDISILDPILAPSMGTPFNRTAIMKSLATGLGVKFIDPDAGMATLEKNIEADVFTPDQILAAYKNPVNAFIHSCGMCHHNFEGVPPAFLGLKQASTDLVGKCQRIEMCAPRMLYRLKMRNCAPEQIAALKKNPMPLANFFSSTKVDIATWQKTVAPQLIQFATKLVRPAEVVSYMVSQGVDKAVAQSTVNELTQSNCPNVDYKNYENLPRCEFAQLKADSSCGSLMTAFGNN